MYIKEFTAIITTKQQLKLNETSLCQSPLKREEYGIKKSQTQTFPLRSYSQYFIFFV